jgi:hypothetical protein
MQEQSFCLCVDGMEQHCRQLSKPLNTPLRNALCGIGSDLETDGVWLLCYDPRWPVLLACRYLPTSLFIILSMSDCQVGHACILIHLNRTDKLVRFLC